MKLNLVLRFNHVASEKTARAIFGRREGFPEVTRYVDGRELTGVLLSEAPPANPNLQVGLARMTIYLSLSEADLAPYELVGAGGPRREWCVPAAIVNEGTIACAEFPY